MIVSLFWRFQVKNFDLWLNPDPEGLAQMFKEQGVLAYSLHRSSDDPNSLMFYTQFPDEETAKSFGHRYSHLPGDIWQEKTKV